MKTTGFVMVQRFLMSLVSLCLFTQTRNVLAVEVLSEQSELGARAIDRELPIGTCTEIRLGRDRELPIYKDFTVLGLIDLDPKQSHRMAERPLLGSFSGVLFINRLGPARRLKNLAFLSSVVERRDKAVSPESLFVPAMLCGENSYQGSLGYLELGALRAAREDDFGDQLPPSTLSNPIPRLRSEIN